MRGSEGAKTSIAGRAIARVTPYLPALAGSAIVGFFCVRAVLRAAGEPAAPLDDTFIHLTFARRIAEGRFFHYVAGEGYSSGATSLVWPLLLAPFHLLGLRGTSLIWAAWILGGVAHAALAVEIMRLTRPLAGRAAAAGAMLMTLLFPAFAWFAWSGMETMALAWILARAARLAAAWIEPDREHRPSVGALIAAGVLGPLIRPEGALSSLMVAVALARRPPEGPRSRRLLALAPLAGIAVAPLLNLIFTGHASSATAQVKWAIGNPYYGASAILGLFAYNTRVLVGNVINGGDWTWIFLPENAAIPVLLGVAALAVAGARRKVPAHALAVGALTLAVLAPCTYLSFLWNRLRYVWPFAAAWGVLLGCLAREIGDLARRRWPRATFVTPLFVGLGAGALAMRLPWAIRDLAQSAAAVAKQQVALGRWARDNLPPTARLGVNDTGAIAYLAERPTFDVVGLTTEGEARYWVAGAGARFEHYEKLPRERLPTHFLVYPSWMGCTPVLGKQLHEATVLDQSILGGATMVVYEARWDLLGSGAAPAEPPASPVLVDELDVADLASEAAHHYDLSASWDVDCQARMAAVGGRVVADGGRVNRAGERFRIKLPAGKTAQLVMRVEADWPTTLDVAVAGATLTADIAGDGLFAEPSVTIPAGPGGEVEVKVTARIRGEGGGEPPRYGSFHYWVYADR